MGKEVVNTNEIALWEAPEPYRRVFGLMFERDVTPTKNLTAGIVILPPGKEQPKLSSHQAEEIYYVIRGKGRFVLDEKEIDVAEGSAVYVGWGVKHRALNTGEQDLELFWVN